MGVRGGETWRNVGEGDKWNPPIIKRPEETSWKDTNPKSVFGDKKLPQSAVPSTLQEYAALAFTEGALKYGRYNWRVSGVRTSTYIDAAIRHIQKYWEGEWADPVTRVPHLASVLACIGIVLDADRMRKLTDDRPPSLPNHSTWIEAQGDIIEHLQKLFADKTPKQYTIKDTPVAFNSEKSCPSK